MNQSEYSIKGYVKRYFSDELLNDETTAGDMERKQLRKWLLAWSQDYTGDPSYLREWALNQPQQWYHQD
jgi:hypothetical protein